MDEESIEVENTKQQPVKEVAIKGKGKKGKKARCVAYLYTKTYDLLVINLFLVGWQLPSKQPWTILKMHQFI